MKFNRSRLSMILIVLVLGVSAGACHAKCRFVRVAEGDFLTVRGEYVVVRLSDAFMKRYLGPTWAGQSLYYGTSDVMTERGPAQVLAPLTPIGKANATLVFGGDHWEHLNCRILAYETRQVLPLTFDMRAPAVVDAGPVRVLSEAPRIRDDGKVDLVGIDSLGRETHSEANR